MRVAASFKAATWLWLLVGASLCPLGGARADPLTLIPSVTLSEEYTDNVFFREDPQWDFLTRVRLGLGLTYETPRSRTTLATGTSGVYLARQTDQSQINIADAQQFFLTTTYQVTPRFSLGINDGFVRTKDTRDLNFILSPGGISTPPPVSDPSDNNPGNASVFLPRGSAINNSFGISGAYAFAPLWTTTLAYTNGYGWFSDPDAENLVQRGLVTLGRQWSPSLTFNGSYAYSRFNNTNAPDSQSNAIYIGASYQYSEMWSGVASAGASLNNSIETGGAPQRINAVYNLAITRLLQEGWQVTAGVSQNVTPSVGVAGASVTLNTYLASWAELGDRFTGTFYLSYSNFDATGADFYLLNTQIGLFYPLWRDVFAGFIYGFRQRDSEPGIDQTSGETINGNSVRLQVSTTWPFRFDI